MTWWWSWRYRRAIVWLREIRDTLNSIDMKVDTLMANEQDLQDDLDTIKAGIVSVAAKLTAQAQTIADLQAQIAAGTPVSQAQLDALKSEADDIVAALSPLTA